MYGLPMDLDLSCFTGRMLEYVGFTRNTVHLGFDGEVSITVESSFAHSNSVEVLDAPKINIPAAESRLMQLVGAKIISASGRGNALVLQFDNGQSVACFDDNSKYESYRITVGDKEFVV